jgi:hypothetical protein
MVTPAQVEAIEGEVREVEPIRAVVVAQPGQAIVAEASATGPTEMLERATAIATALSAMVEKQRLYTVISGKKYPQVEAWMTIGRMDNVVAREAAKPVRADDGSWEAEVELVRLSDGMVIGRASALCGAKGDRPWDTRPDHQRRSMAVTRATSRAFRQQYSWIMALAGYEPTPADEMPDDRGETREPERPATSHEDGLVGTAEAGKGQADFQLRQSPDGPVLAFRLTQGRKGYKVIAFGDLAGALATLRKSVEGQRVTVWGTFHDETFAKDGRDITYQVVHLERIATPDGVLPAPLDSAPPAEAEERPEAPSTPMFELTPDEAAAVGGAR